MIATGKYSPKRDIRLDMSFPDQIHINRLRDALWRRSGNGASVMVGSGFSRNAVPIRPGIGPLPTWLDIAIQLHGELYPESEKPHTPESAPRIAQEYESAFDRVALHNTLQELVRDGDYSPSEVHTRLVKLPWDGIYTTNWDTLLERTAEPIVEQSYGVVRNKEQIPMTSRPRIVKLHGSLPSQFPLIVTEEDYRTYPTEFAPFVNTVQQAMMETVFCLIGFSGDDPNFLKWSGWVRDNLGSSAQTIYLAGFLQLSPPRRIMLEKLNVTPIDLARHPKANTWPENKRHELAIKWLLHTLEMGQPYDITNWPIPPTETGEPIDPILEPIEVVRSREPMAEPPVFGHEDKVAKETVLALTKIWKHNREMYPGWITVPYSKRRLMGATTDEWGRRVLLSLTAVTLVERLYALRELVWREEVLLVPMYPHFESAIEETLYSIDCQSRTINGDTAPREDWATLREAWRDMASALLTASRHRFDRESFDKWLRALQHFQDEDLELFHRIRHEQCLWAIWDLDFQVLDDLLNNWDTENCDPVWSMRKSALLWETGHFADAEKCLNDAIYALRAIPAAENSVTIPSRETWATLVALGWENQQASFRRLRELVPLWCDAFAERQSASEDLGNSRPDDDPPVFDINRRRGTTLRYSNYDPQSAVYRAIRLSEMAGLPPHRQDNGIQVTVWAEVLRQAAVELAGWDLQKAVRLILRTCRSTDNALEHVLSRPQIATLENQQAEELAQACLRVVDKEMGSLMPAMLQPRTATALEALSRLAIRVSPELAESVLNRAIEYCQSPDLAQGMWGNEIENLLVRSWEALPTEVRTRRAFDLLTMPIAGLDSSPPLMENRWPEPSAILANTRTPLPRNNENEHVWQEAISLVASALVSNGPPRLRASIRMIPLIDSGQLNEEETQRIAEALWCPSHTPPDALPIYTRLFDWSFLTLPEPAPGLALDHFKARWLGRRVTTGWQHKPTIEIYGNSLNGLNHDNQDLDSCLWQVGSAILSLQRQARHLALSETEKADLRQLLEIWADAPLPDPLARDHPLHHHVAKAHQQRFQQVAEAIPAIISEVTLPTSVGEKLYSKLQILVENQVPVFSLAPSIVQGAPEKMESVATTLRVGLTSDDQELAESAISAVRLWIEAASDSESNPPQPPDDLVREVGISIASRKSTVIKGALRTARWVFEEGSQSHRDIIRQLAEDGLSYLATELSYVHRHENPDDVPLQRLLCAQLAMAMYRDGLGQHSAVSRWLEIARDDPLPEVRNAVDFQ